MIYVLIPLLLLLAVWVGAIYRRLRELDDNIKIAMEQIGLQLSSRFRALEALLELTAVAESRPAIKADKTYQRCIEAANCYNRMIYTSSLIYNDSVTRFNNTLKQKHFAPLAGLLGFAPREYLQFAPDAPVVCSAQPTPPTQPPTQKEPA